jgi:hypothetical protein
VPGLDQLEELICSFARAGLKVTPEVTGQTRPLPEAVELTATHCHRRGYVPALVTTARS